MRTRFGEFVLDSKRRELTRNGEACHLSTKAFLLLEVLVDNAPNALTKDELYRHIWGETFVEEVNLPNLVSEIRGVLGDNRSHPRFVKTIHGYGYAFAGELERERTSRRRSGHLFSLFWNRDEFPLRDGDNIVGRGDEADVVVDSASVSRRHARIAVSMRSAAVEDLGSKNGTFVRGERVEGKVSLRDGDEIRVGHVTFTFRAVSRTATTVTGTRS